MRRIIVTATIGLCALLPAPAQTPVGTAFTYQGSLRQTGSPASGPYDLQFKLFDAATAGTQIGLTVSRNDLPVVESLFTTALDFGADAFGADARWIEIAVRPGSSVGAFTTLSPRQRVSPAPLAIKSLNDANWSVTGDDIHNSNAGDVGIGESTALAKLHVTGSTDLGTGFDGTQLDLEKVLIEAGAAWLGLYSDQVGHPGSGITLGEFNIATGATDKWAIFRRTTADNGELRFTFGTNIDPTENLKVMQLGTDGQVGIGTSPNAPLHVYAENESYDAPVALRVETRQTPSSFDFNYRLDLSGSGVNAYDVATGGGLTLSLNSDSSGDVQMVRGGGSVGIGTVPAVKLHVSDLELGFTDTALAADDLIVEDDNAWIGIYSNDVGSGGSGVVLAEVNQSGTLVDKWAMYRRTTAGSEGDLVVSFGANADPLQNEIMFQVMPDGTTKVQVLEITGADVAERFPVTTSVDAGMVVEIDPDNAGQLRLASSGAYNRRVAGVVSGAGNLPIGAILGNLPNSEHAPPVALSGRVWVNCDASDRAIEPGDLLTTADRAGHAMAVADHARASGATIGKAMSALKQGEIGQVLVLVNLQ